MEQFVHDQNLALFRLRLCDPKIVATERKIIEGLPAEEEAKGHSLRSQAAPVETCTVR
jgi:hypothetical protein